MYAYVLNHAYHLFLIPKSSSIALTILVVTSDLAKQKNKSFIWQTHMVSMDIIDVEPYIVRVFFVCVESSYTTCLLNPQKHWTLSFVHVVVVIILPPPQYIVVKYLASNTCGICILSILTF